VKHCTKLSLSSHHFSVEADAARTRAQSMDALSSMDDPTDTRQRYWRRTRRRGIFPHVDDRGGDRIIRPELLLWRRANGQLCKLRRQCPGKKSTDWLRNRCVARMVPGSVAVDLARRAAGTCELIDARRPKPSRNMACRVTMIGQSIWPPPFPISEPEYAPKLTAFC